MRAIRISLSCFIGASAAASTQAAFVPTSPMVTKPTSNNQLYSAKPSTPLANLQDNIDKLNPLSTSQPKVPSPPTPPPFDPTDPEALIAVTKSFIATDFGIQSSLLPSYSTAQKNTNNDMTNDDPMALSALPFYSSSLLSPSFLWVSANNLNDGRAGILNKAEYLAAGRFFDLRKSFPDLEWRAHDFRVTSDEAGMYDGGDSKGVREITVRFTTLAVGTFRGSPLRLRSKTLPPNGKVMRCPPTSVSITYAASGENAGKIIKLVNDMVLDRQFGNTNGLSGIAGAAVVAGAPPSDWEVFPPFMSISRIFARPIKMIRERDEDEGYLPPFPDSVMIQLAKGVAASDFGLEDPDLLSNDFTYLEPLMGPIDKERYIEMFEELNIREAVPDLDYQFQNYRIDPYDPYRVWVDTRARGTRSGPIGKSIAPTASKYLAPPESWSFTFDNDGFCTRITAAAPLDPLLGNTGLLGGVYGLLYATDTPENPLKTRTLNLLLNRAQKVALKSLTKAGIDEYRLSDGRIISGNKPVAQLPASSSTASVSTSLPTPPKLPSPPAKPEPKTPFFASTKASSTISLSKKTTDSTLTTPRPKATTVALPNTSTEKTAAIQTTETKSTPSKPQADKISPPKQISSDPQDPVTDAFSSFFGTSEVTSTPTSTKSVTPPSESSIKSASKVEELKRAAAAARKEAADAKQRAAERKALLETKKATAPVSPVTTIASQTVQTSQSTPKRSPTLSIFGDSLDSTSSNKSKSTTTADVSASSSSASKSPTFSLFGSSSTPSTKSTAPTPQPKTPSKVSKRSPTFSLFGSSSSPSLDPTTSPAPQKTSPTLSLFGTKALDPKASASAPSKSPKKSARKGSVAKKAQTFSIAGVGGGTPKQQAKKKSKGKDGPKKTSTKKGTTKKAGSKKNDSKSSTFAFFGERKTATSIKKEITKSDATKSPTFSLFQSAKSNDSPPKIVATKSPTFSLFKGTEKSKPEPAKVNEQSSRKATKPSSSSNSLFGGFFGGSSTSTGKEPGVDNKSLLPSSQTKTSTSQVTKKQSTADVPVLKRWKVNEDNSIEARIYGSGSFRDGATVTTSPIGKQFKIANGSIVQTSSGSKYKLE